MVCSQPLLIHRDGTGTCAAPGCLHSTLAEAVVRHRTVVNCQAVLGRRCAVCHRPARGALAGMASGRAVELCPGSALVHADLGLECSEGACVTTAERGSWLARHADVRSCSSLAGGCPTCGGDLSP